MHSSMCNTICKEHQDLFMQSVYVHPCYYELITNECNVTFGCIPEGMVVYLGEPTRGLFALTR